MVRAVGSPEEWRAVLGGPGYGVSSWGRVRSWRYGRAGGTLPARLLLVQRAGYRTPQVFLRLGGNGAMKSVGVLMLEAFVRPRPAGQVLRFRDGDPHNLALGNLFWGPRMGRGAPHGELRERLIQAHREALLRGRVGS